MRTSPGSRWLPGPDAAGALRAADRLIADGLHTSFDLLAGPVRDAARAAEVRDTYLRLVAALGARGLGPRAEISFPLGALGLFTGRDGAAGAAAAARAAAAAGAGVALAHARELCAAAAGAGVAVTVDMQDHRSTDAVLAAVAELRADFPDLGVAVQANLRRSEADCRTPLLSGPGVRVRLVKGAYREPVELAFGRRAEIDRAYVRCLRVLMAGGGRPMVATHDPRLIAIAGALAVRHGRPPGSFEYQFLYGVRAREQRVLARAGELVRVWIPFGARADAAGYLRARRRAELRRLVP